MNPKKKILIYTSNEFASLEMVALLTKQKYDLTVIIEYYTFSDSIKNIIKIFSFYTKKIYLIQLDIKLNRFYLKSIIFFFQNYYQNKKLIEKINKFHKKNSIRVSNYNEIWFTNDTSSKFTCLNFKGTKKYFFHAIIDIRNLEELSFFKFIIKYIECTIDRLFYKILPIYHNFFDGRFYSLVNEKISKNINYNKLNLIPFKLYKNFISKFYSNIKIKFKKKNKIILINAHNFYGYSNKVLKNYFENVSQEIYRFLKQSIKIEQYQVVLKFKSNNKKEINYIILNIFKDKFKLIEVSVANKYFSKHIPIEIFAYLIKPEILISLNTTSDWIIKKLLPNTKIYDISSYLINFWFNNKKIITKSHRNILNSMIQFNKNSNFKFEKILN
jgi:hypothetical protein